MATNALKAPRPKHPKRGRDAGFTLIEVLGAAVILAIALGAVMSVEVSSLWSNRLSRNLQNGAQVAADSLESVHRSTLSGLASGSLPTVTIDTIGFAPTLTVTALTATLYKLAVVVTWQDDSSFVNGASTTHSVSAEMLRTTLQVF